MTSPGTESALDGCNVRFHDQSGADITPNAFSFATINHRLIKLVQNRGFPTINHKAGPVMSFRIVRTAALILAVTGFAVGCGGGSGGDPSGSPAANRPPQVIGHNSAQRWYLGHSASYDTNLNGAVFQDPDGDPLTYEITFNSQPDPPLPGFSVSGSVISATNEQGATGLTIKVVARDSHGATSIPDTFRLDIFANAAPEVAQTNANQIVSAGPVDYDALQGGVTFRDPDGQALTYSLQLLTASVPATVAGTRIQAVFDGPGFVKAKLTATDEFGAATDDVFALVVPTPISSRPTLPTQSFIYEDARLPLPSIHAISLQHSGPLWDTTPPDNLTTDAGATLGRVLFYDKRLSITNTVSCSSCHEQSRGFTVGTAFATGVFGEHTLRNPMALANSRYNQPNRYFFDMRVFTLENLALVPIQDQRELGNTLPLLEEKLAASDFYPQLFQAAFGTPEVTSERIAKALAQFLRSLISYRAKHDAAFHPLVGELPPDPQTILTAAELRGDNLFLSAGCSGCHEEDSGTLDRGANNGLDVVSADPGMPPRSIFRPASLRNIAVSGPYMHDGRFATLREVIDFYDHGVQPAEFLSDLLIEFLTGLPRQLNLSEEDKQDLEAFLNTFTDTPLLTDPKFSDPFQ
jgi:cytochrome c peroxidase